jgi:hypothetical protein
LHETLLHELCHAAAWLLDGAHKPPHGNLVELLAFLYFSTYYYSSWRYESHYYYFSINSGAVFRKWADKVEQVLYY